MPLSKKFLLYFIVINSIYISISNAITCQEFLLQVYNDSRGVQPSFENSHNNALLGVLQLTANKSADFAKFGFKHEALKKAGHYAVAKRIISASFATAAESTIGILMFVLTPVTLGGGTPPVGYNLPKNGRCSSYNIEYRSSLKENPILILMQANPSHTKNIIDNICSQHRALQCNTYSNSSNTYPSELFESFDIAIDADFDGDEPNSFDEASECKKLTFYKNEMTNFIDKLFLQAENYLKLNALSTAYNVSINRYEQSECGMSRESTSTIIKIKPHKTSGAKDVGGGVRKN